ncbi:MAG: hypothetical protein ABIY63_18135 [Fibrobacteria bacterium]
MNSNGPGTGMKSADGIFQKPKNSGGGGSAASRAAKRQAESDKKSQEEWDKQDNETARKSVVEDPPVEKGEVVKLSNPKWAKEKGQFNEKMITEVDVDLPDTHKHLTRVSFTLFAASQGTGKLERIDAKDAHVKEGKASVEFTLFYPQQKDGQLVKECPYVCVMKHRDSKELESPKLEVVATVEYLTLKEAQGIAFEITKEYETSGSYSKLAGNFDGAGLSFGSMQWNIKWGTLQKMLGKFKQADEAAFEACFDKDAVAFTKIKEVMAEKQADGDEDGDGESVPFPEGMKWAKATHSKAQPPYGWLDHWDTYFKKIGENATFQVIQKQTSIDDNHKRTMSKIEWMKGISPDLWAEVYLNSYCALFDLCNQHQTVRKATRKKLEAEWKKSAPATQVKMVESLSSEVAKAGTFSEQSLGRRMGILKAAPNAGSGWMLISNSLLGKYLKKEKVIQDI